MGWYRSELYVNAGNNQQPVTNKFNYIISDVSGDGSRWDYNRFAANNTTISTTGYTFGGNASIFNSAFYGCSNFYGNVKFETNNLRRTDTMFYECYKLNRDFDITYNTTNSIKNNYQNNFVYGNSTFVNCYNFNSDVNIKVINANDAYFTTMFSGCNRFNRNVRFETDNVFNLNLTRFFHGGNIYYAMYTRNMNFYFDFKNTDNIQMNNFLTAYIGTASDYNQFKSNYNLNADVYINHSGFRNANGVHTLYVSISATAYNNNNIVPFMPRFNGNFYIDVDEKMPLSLSLTAINNKNYTVDKVHFANHPVTLLSPIAFNYNNAVPVPDEIRFPTLTKYDNWEEAPVNINSRGLYFIMGPELFTFNYYNNYVAAIANRPKTLYVPSETEYIRGLFWPEAGGTGLNVNEWTDGINIYFNNTDPNYYNTLNNNTKGRVPSESESSWMTKATGRFSAMFIYNSVHMGHNVGCPHDINIFIPREITDLSNVFNLNNCSRYYSNFPFKSLIARYNYSNTSRYETILYYNNREWLYDENNKWCGYKYTIELENHSGSAPYVVNITMKNTYVCTEHTQEE